MTRFLPRPWWPLLAVLLAAFNLRIALSVTPPLLSTLESDLGLSARQASVLGSISPLAFAVSGLAGIVVMRRLGLERCAALAMALAALGQLGRPLFHSPVVFLVLSGVALLGMGLGNVVVPPLVKRHFAGSVTVVTGLYAVMLQAGSAVSAQSAVPVAHAAGWRFSLALWGLVAALAAAAWVVVSRRSHRRRAETEVATRLPLSRVARSPLAWGMACLFGCQSLTAYAVLAWLPTVYVDAGLPQSTGGTALAVFALLQVPMSLFAPVLVGRIPRPFLLIASFAVVNLVAYSGLAFATHTLPLMWAALLGVGSGSFPVALALIGIRAQTPAGSASLSSFAQGFGYLLAILGPLVTGMLRTATGSWGASLGFLAAVMVPLLVGAAVSSRHRTLESEIGV